MSGGGTVVDDCLFCRIVAGQVPSREAYNGELAYGFHDIEPAAPFHVLIVPRAHVTSAADLGLKHGDVLAEMFVAARQAAAAGGYDRSGYRLVFNVGEDAGMAVPHLHLHVLAGRSLGWPPG